MPSSDGHRDVLYLLRHWPTACTAADRFCGRHDPPLLPEARFRVRDFAAAWDDAPWAAVYASPQRRASETAEIVGDHHGVAVRRDDDLRELDYGDWDGRSRPEVEATSAYRAWAADPVARRPPGGEAGREVLLRSLRVLSRIAGDVPRGSVLVVSHKAVIRLLTCYLLGMDVRRFRDRVANPSGSVIAIGSWGATPMLLAAGRVGRHDATEDGLAADRHAH